MTRGGLRTRRTGSSSRLHRGPTPIPTPLDSFARCGSSFVRAKGRGRPRCGLHSMLCGFAPSATRRGRLARVCSAALPISLLGCGADAPDSLPSPGQELQLDLERTHGSPPSLELSRVESVAIDSRGRIFVVDGLQGGITVLSSALNPLQVVGRAGEGPGEFRQRQIQILDGDSLAVYDSDLGRVTVFDPDSFTVVRTFRPLGFESRTPAKYWALGQNRSLSVARQAFYARGSADDDDHRHDVVMVSGLSVTEVDTVLIMPSPEMLVVRAPGFVSVGNHPYGTQPLIQPLDSMRIVYAHTEEARVLILGVGGDTIGSGWHPTEPVDVSQRQLQEEIAENWNGPLADALRTGAPYRWPVVVALVPVVGTEQAHVWMSVRGPADTSTWPLLVFDSSGRHTATSSLPAGMVLRAVRGDIALATSTDSVGVPWIHRYRVAAPRRR